MTDQDTMTDEAADLTPEELEAYVAALEAESAPSFEEQHIALQAQADLHDAQTQERARQREQIRRLRRAFKGIYSRNEQITLAKLGLMEAARINDAYLDAQKESQS